MDNEKHELWKRKSFSEIDTFQAEIWFACLYLRNTISHWETDKNGEIIDDVYSDNGQKRLYKYIEGQDSDDGNFPSLSSFIRRLNREVKWILKDHYDIDVIRNVIVKFLIPPLTKMILEYVSGDYDW